MVAYFKQVVESGVNIRNRLFLLAILILFLASTLPFLTVFPPVDNVGDESWMTSISVEMLKTGSPVASIHAGTPIGEKAQIITMWIYSGVLSLFFFIFGASLWTGRILSLACGLVVVLLTYRFGCKMVNPKVGLASSFLLITSIAFSWHSREIRPDMMLMAFSTAGVYLFYIWTEKRDDKYLFLCGLVSTLSVQAHPNGAIFAFSTAFIYMIISRKNLISRSSLSLVSGFFIGFVLWLVFNYLPYSTSSFQTIHKKYLPPILNMDFFKDGNFIVLLKGSLKFIWLITVSNLDVLRIQYYSNIPIGIAYFALLLIAIGVIFGKNRSSSVFLLSFIFLPLVIANFIVGSWQWFHYSVFLPFGFMVLAISIYDISEMFRSVWVKRQILIGATIIIGGLGIMDIMMGNIEMSKYNYNSVKEKITRNIPDNVTVMGAPLYYFAFLDGKGKFITYMFLEERCPDFKSEMRTHRVDYILIDDSLEYMTRLWCSNAYYENEIVKFLTMKTYKDKMVEIDYPNSRAPNRMLNKAYLFRVNDP